jgi:hypothetical protein
VVVVVVRLIVQVQQPVVDPVVVAEELVVVKRQAALALLDKGLQVAQVIQHYKDIQPLVAVALVARGETD